MSAVSELAREERAAGMWERMKARVSAGYALRIYLPASILAEHIRAYFRRRRGTTTAASSRRLACLPWSRILKGRRIRLVETQKHDGNVRVSELALLAQIAAAVPPGSDIVEIGTFDGRTTLNLAVNAARGVSIATLDLPASDRPALAVEESERRYIDKPRPGARLRACGEPWSTYAGRVAQLHGDSATFDWSSRYGRAGLVFVDGAHSYEYARKDSETAMRLVQAEGVVVWHDYGVWPGVTQALEELEAERRLGLCHIRGTSLVIWRSPAVNRVPERDAGQVDGDGLELAPTEVSDEFVRSSALG